MSGVLVLVLDREERLNDHGALDSRGNEARHHVHTLERHGVALGQRPVDDGADPDEHVPRLVVEADERRVLGLVRGSDRCGRFEARVVDRGHEVDREERPHRLPYEVRGGDPRDAETVGDFSRDGRLAGPRSAPDEEDQRKIQLLQDAVAPEPAHGILPLVLGEHLGDQLVQMRLGEGVLLVLAHELLLDQPRELVGTHGPEAGSGQRLRHEALRVRKPPPFLPAERLGWSPVAHRLTRPASGSEAEARDAHAVTERHQGTKPRVEVTLEGRDCVVGEDDLNAPHRRSLGDDVDGGRLQLDEEDLGCPCRFRSQLGVERLPAAQVARNHHDLRALRISEVRTKTVVDRRRRRREVGHAPAGERLDRPGTEHGFEDLELGVDVPDRGAKRRDRAQGRRGAPRSPSRGRGRRSGGGRRRESPRRAPDPGRLRRRGRERPPRPAAPTSRCLRR